MSNQIYLHLLILCGALYQGIVATLSAEDTRESSDFLVRKRRVISHLPIGALSIPIENANYMVGVQVNNRTNCAGVILSHYTVLTSATCLRSGRPVYKILSSAAFVHLSQTRNVTSTRTHYGNFPYKETDGIALLKVDPPFVFNRKTGSINLHVGLLTVGTRVTVFGWGCIYPPQPPPPAINKRRLRSITLSIMNHGECHNIYGDDFSVTDKYICTYDAQQYCARTDIGAPLIVNGTLAGIHVWKGERQNHRNPDVFLDLTREDYRQLIRETIAMQSIGQ